MPEFHRYAVLALRQTYARSAFADTRRRIILGTEKHADLSVLDGCRRIERIAFHPSDRILAHRTEKFDSRIRLDNGINLCGTDESAQGPFRQPISVCGAFRSGTPRTSAAGNHDPGH